MSVKIESPFTLTPGNTPLLISMPHCGTRLLPNMAATLTDEAKRLPDTDWYIPELYDFAPSLGAGVIRANYSRLVIDLNRPLDDTPLYSTTTTGLFSDTLFSGAAVFLDDHAPSDELKAQLKQHIWQPYHQQIAAELARIKAQFGYAILFDAHSIAAQVPMLFDGTLPDFNFGNHHGRTCSTEILDRFAAIVRQTPYRQVCNGRFTGGHITRHFGQPAQHIHAVQLELSQATYLADQLPGYQLDHTKQARLSAVLQQLIQSLLELGNPAECGDQP